MARNEETGGTVPEDTPQADDVDMGEGAEAADATAEVAEVEATGDHTELPFAGEETIAHPRTTFISYLMSSVIRLVVGPPDSLSSLTAHQTLLTQSPYFAEVCKNFVDDGSPRQIELPDENIEAVGSFLEFLYTGEYFPKKVPGTRKLDTDPAAPSVDDTGDQLLKHARIYTLAEKYGVTGLKTLASSKIHCVNSTARGEIAYARYVYQHTRKDDTTVRAPIASFWATRSHTLRSEAETEFKALCLEFPEFGYDVLTRVLDDKLKRERSDKMHPSTGSGRKRPRHSTGA
ncbi:uncharacterized protein J7T54_001824 [Emericellopsis cladophorae]|uniref:BTB domain-containing protein n=1 Tax=Emericellopsis cladophorae TaxID=2686198 RepID=A0A9P9Y637_9HYPO|nr:uncharacterized protein J7T54_001824 [Emericellopsis cladophorae]KAI6783948.1 hypothetical protein J7T54_001824 [Emericellopsis cladophorae]